VDFIERLFGVAPDGGDGSLEALWIGAIVVVALAFVFRRRIWPRFKETSYDRIRWAWAFRCESLRSAR